MHLMHPTEYDMVSDLVSRQFYKRLRHKPYVLSYLIVLTSWHDYHTICLLVFISEQELTYLRIMSFNTLII